MSLFKKKPPFAVVLRESVLALVGAVLIWRGIWVLLERFDARFFGGNHVLSALIGITIGVIMIYFADKDIEDLV